MSDNNTLRWWEWISLPALLAGLIYVTGWSYAYAYFALFNLGLLAIDVPGEYFIIYGFWVLRDHGWLVLVYFAFITLWWLLCHYWQVAQSLLTALIPLLLLFISSYQLARHSAVQHFQAQQQQDYPDYPRVKIWLKEHKDQDPQLQAIAASLSKGCYRLLLQSPEQARLFYTRKNTPLAKPAVLHVPMGEVRVMRVFPQYGSC